MGKGCCVHDGDACAVHGMLECGATVDGRCPFSGNATEQAVYCSSYSQDAPDGKTAEAWVDVKRKGELIYSRGGVTNLRESPVEVDATVRSDMLRGEKGVRVDLGGPYEVTLSKRSWENRNNVGGYVQGFLCECQWGQYHSGQPGSGWQGRLCFPPHEKVLMGDGSYRDICDVKIGDSVQTIDGAHEVTDTMSREYDGDIVVLSFSGSGDSVAMTAGHPVVSNPHVDYGEARECGIGSFGPSDMSVSRWDGTVPAESLHIGDPVLFTEAHGVASGDEEGVRRVDASHTVRSVVGKAVRRHVGRVFNLTVSGNHTYVVSGLTVHNCSHAYATALASGSRFRQDFMRDHESSRVSADGQRPYTCAEEFFSDVVEATYCGDEGARRRVAAMGREAVDDMRRGMRLRRASEDECVATWGGLSRKVATRRISADEMRELEHEIDGKELRNRGKLKMQAPDAATDDDFLWM